MFTFNKSWPKDTQTKAKPLNTTFAALIDFLMNNSYILMTRKMSFKRLNDRLVLVEALAIPVPHRHQLNQRVHQRVYQSLN